MEMKTLKQLARVAKVRRDPPAEAPTRKTKLLAWAEAVERFGKSCSYVNGYHDIESWTKGRFQAAPIAPSSAEGIAIGDPTLQKMGLKAANLGGICKFFEISQAELHKVDCYCHADMSTNAVAGRIRKLAEKRGIRRFFGKAA
jgi:hypothetical protein